MGEDSMLELAGMWPTRLESSMSPRGVLMLRLTPTTMVATAMAWAMAMAMVSMVATTGASMARGVLMLRPTPTTMVAMAMVAMAMAMVSMVATTGANKDLAKHQDGILSLFRTGQL